MEDLKRKQKLELKRIWAFNNRDKIKESQKKAREKKKAQIRLLNKDVDDSVLFKIGRRKKIKSLEEILAQKQKTALYLKKHRQTQEHKQKRKSQKSYQTDYRRCNYKKSHIYTKWYTILSNSVKSSNKKRHKIETDFDSNYIKELFDKQNGLCAYFKIPLVITKIKKHPFKPSIDRIDNSKGYTKDNIVLCCLMANMGRNSCSYEEWMKCLDGLEIKKKCSM